MITQIVSSAICWAIVIVALFTYQQLLASFLLWRSNPSAKTHAFEGTHALCNVCIGTMPLLGLLGTIVGLLECFSAMANGHGAGEVLSSGIGSALFTTQLGLVCALPGWLLQAYLRAHTTRHAQAPSAA